MCLNEAVINRPVSKYRKMSHVLYEYRFMGILSLAEQLLASQEGLCSAEFVRHSVVSIATGYSLDDRGVGV
jgi:hypothetical protein